MKIGRTATNGAFVSVSPRQTETGSIFQEIRRPDGSKVVALNRDAYDRALSSAKAVLTKRAGASR